MKRMALLALLWGTTVLSAQTTTFLDDRTVAIEASEGQSTIVAPGHPQCAAGRIIVSSDVAPGQPGNIVYRDFNGTTTTASTFEPLPNAGQYRFLTSDHDLVSMSNGDVYYLTGAGSEVPLNPSPSWFDFAHRTTLGPGARSVLLVWRSTDCGTTFQYMPDMEFDPATLGDGSCAFPQGQLTHFHDPGETHYLVPFRDFSTTGDDRFAWCQACQQLFLNDPSQPTVCPRNGGEHSVSSDNYELATQPIPNFENRATFKVCKRCGTVFSTSARHTACGSQTHDAQGSPEYFMPFGDPPLPKSGRAAKWRWCSKCHTMFDGSTALKGCPLGASHDLTVSSHYDVKKFAGTTAPSAKKWTKCSKCGGIFERGAKGNVCAITEGKHVDSGIDLQLFTSKPATGDSQGEWKRCNRCGLFFFGPNQWASHCPLVRPHNAGAGATTYQLPIEPATAPPNTLQTLWRICTKCGSVHYSGDGGGSCVIERDEDIPVFDMGGSDGQLVMADTMTDRLYMTFRCVGRELSTNPGKFDLTGKFLDRTLVAFTQGAQPWTLLPTPAINAWRTQIVPLDPVSIAIGGGWSDTFFRATKSANKWTLSSITPVNGGVFDYTGVDWDAAPYNTINANIRSHTVFAQTPGTNKTVVVVPSTIPNQGHGFRIFFETTPGQFSEAVKPITPATKSTKDVAFHLQAISSSPGGPVLLYWYDFDTVANAITIRGRLITGDGKYSKNDFAISRLNNAARSFPPVLKRSYGDYQTADGYLRSDGRHVFHPMWVESPDNIVHFGTVIYDPAMTLQAQDFVTAVKPQVFKKTIPFAEWKLTPQMRATEEERERERD